MKLKILLGMIFSAALITLSGCGGGGGGSAAAPAVSTKVSGTPFKGAFNSGGSVKIFGVDANNVKRATPLSTAQLALIKTRQRDSP